MFKQAHFCLFFPWLNFHFLPVCSYYLMINLVWGPWSKEYIQLEVFHRSFRLFFVLSSIAWATLAPNSGYGEMCLTGIVSPSTLAILSIYPSRSIQQIFFDSTVSARSSIHQQVTETSILCLRKWVLFFFQNKKSVLMQSLYYFVNYSASYYLSIPLFITCGFCLPAYHFIIAR